MQAKSQLAKDRKLHPFLVPRRSAATGACAAQESCAPAGLRLPLPPALPAIHVPQVYEARQVAAVSTACFK